MAEGFEPSHGRINGAVPYQLGYATRELAAAARFELAHPRLQDERSVIQLSYAAIWWTGRDSNPHKKFAGLLCCRYITSPEKHCQFPIVDCRLNISVFTVNRQLQIGNELVAEAGVEPAPFRL